MGDGGPLVIEAARLVGGAQGPGERQHEPRSLYLLENEGFHSSDEGTKE